MNLTSRPSRVELKHILYLTDFSEPSESALRFAAELARGYDAEIHALHVVLPPLFGYNSPSITQSSIGISEERAREEMLRIDSELAGLSHDSSIEIAPQIWPAVENAINTQQIQMIVLGTRGRTGTQRLLLGSVAEEIFRRSPVPVLTIGPQIRVEPHHAGKFHRVLLAMDFTPASLAALPYAFSIAEESGGRIDLLHVIPQRDRNAEAAGGDFSVSESMHRLHVLAGDDDKLSCRPHAIVRYGNPAEQILTAARELNADLIVLGARPEELHLGDATHIKRMTAHAVVARARCPVLTATQRA
jgi:nucleotide-binding universal stress UspA family protein